FHLLLSRSPDAAGIPTTFIVIQSPISVTALAQANQVFWSNLAFWIGAATAVAGLSALTALIIFMLECDSLRSFTQRLQQTKDDNPAQLSDRNRQLLSSFRGEIDLFFSDNVAMPCTFGWFNKYIVIPKNLAADLKRLNIAVRHELIHIKNRDFLMNM